MFRGCLDKNMVYGMSIGMFRGCLDKNLVYGMFRGCLDKKSGL